MMIKLQGTFAVDVDAWAEDQNIKLDEVPADFHVWAIDLITTALSNRGALETYTLQQGCPSCGKAVAWDTTSGAQAWRHEHNGSRFCLGPGPHRVAPANSLNPNRPNAALSV